MWLGIKFGVIALLAFQSTLAERDFTFGLRHSIPGEPDVDYPIYSAIPRTSFTCVGRHEGYYADMEARCQVFRICSNTDFTGKGFPFLCPNGTIFNQKHFVCDWYKNVDCEESGKFYYKNSENGVETKEQMMRKAQMMIEFPMKTLLKAFEKPVEQLQPTPQSKPHIQRTSPIPIQTTRTQVKKSAGTSSYVPTPTRPVKTIPTRIANNPEHAIKTNEVFISNLGELSSDPNTSFNPKTSVIINNSEKPSKLLEAPPFLDLSSFASNINGLVDDVEADGGLVPNVVSARSPKISVPVMKKTVSKGFSMPQQTVEEPFVKHESLVHHELLPSSTTSSNLIASINEIFDFNEDHEARKNADNLLLSGVHLTTFDGLSNSLETSTESLKTVVSEAPLLINVTEEEATSTTEATTTSKFTSSTITPKPTTSAKTTISTTTTTSTTTRKPETTRPTRVSFSKLKVNPNRVSNYKYKYSKGTSTTKSENIDVSEKSEDKTSTTRSFNKYTYNRNFTRTTRTPYKRPTTTPFSLKSKPTITPTSTTKYQYRSTLQRKSPMKLMKFFSKYTVQSNTTTSTSEPSSSTTESSSLSENSTSTEPTNTSSSSTTSSSTTSTTTEPTTTSKYFSFEQLKKSIIDDSILQQYKKTQEEQAKLNPTVHTTFAPVSSIQPIETRFATVPQTVSYNHNYNSNSLSYLGRSRQSFYPQAPQFLNLPRSYAVTTPKPTEHKFQHFNSDILIARSEEHSPFPLETRTARATPVPPASNEYVPLKQYVNKNFPSQTGRYTQHRRAVTPRPQVVQTKKTYPNYSYVQPQHGINYKPQPQTTPRHISTVQEQLPLFPPLVQLKATPQPQTKKQNFQTYQQFAFKNIPIAQRRFGLADYDEENKPNHSLFHGVSSYDVPLSSIGILRNMKQQRLQTPRVQG